MIAGGIAGAVDGGGDNYGCRYCRNEGTVQGITCDTFSKDGQSLGIFTISNELDIYNHDSGTAGGIVGITDREDNGINSCCNYGAVTGYKAGEIAGISHATTISNSCNLGNVQGKGLVYYGESDPDKAVENGLASCVGGIAGLGVNIKDCYNLGHISAGGIYKYDYFTETSTGADKIVRGKRMSSVVGGLVGITGIRNKVNSYNAGNVYGENSSAIAVAGYNGCDVPVFKKCYYLEGTNAVAVNTKYLPEECKSTLNLSSVSKSSLASMLSPEFATELNGNAKAFGATGNVWTTDEKGINRGFPILVGVPYDENIKQGSDTDLDTSGETGKCTHIFSDYSYSSSLSGNIVKVYVNGAKVKEGGVTINYRTCTLFTDICPSYIHTLAKDGKVKSASGKVIAGITMTNSKPMLEKGKIVDKEAANIAKATIRNGQITITAGKKSGVVYLWVMDTGSAGVCDSYPINVKGAPSNIELYNVDTTSNFSYSSATKYRKDNIKVGDTVKVYLYPYMKIGKEVVKATSGSYSATVDSKSTDYVSVKRDSENPYCYIISADSLKNGKKVSGKVTFICNHSGKKVTFTATVVPN